MSSFSFPFTIGHHDQNRTLPVTAEAVASAHATGYDLVTSPITTSHFHSRVLALLSNTLADSGSVLDNVTSSHNASPLLVAPLAPADTPLTPDESVSQMVGMTASWIDLGSSDPVIADISKQVLRLELAYAAFCGMAYVVIPGPRLSDGAVSGGNIVQYARTILDALSQGPFMTLYIWLPMVDHTDNEKQQMGDLAPFARSQYMESGNTDSKRLDIFGAWQAWDIIRSVCKYSTRLCIALSIPRLLPPVPIQSRWFSEPVRILTIDSEVFVKNPKGYPVLSKAHQALISRFTSLKQPATWFLLCDVGPVPRSSNTVMPSVDTNAFPSLAEANSAPQIKDQTPHLSYMRNLQTKRPQKSPVDVFGAGYHDYLQAPLQPLTVNLESVTYEVFEKDPIKYEWYERAIARALHDWIEQGKPTSNPDGRVVVAVVGAGRGPLVTRALQASEAVGVEIDMWALEKNPNAFVLLQTHNETRWNRNVNLVKSDMRTWRGPTRSADTSKIRKAFNLDPDEEDGAEQNKEDLVASAAGYTGSSETDATYLLATATHQPTTYKVDILISELLGSFADNELSPECLDGVQHLLNPTHGISIPSSYTAHITPIAAPKLHADISLGMSNTIPHAAEVPYVVMLNAIDFLSTEVPSPSQKQQHHNPSTDITQPQTGSDTTHNPHRHQNSHSQVQSHSTPTPIIQTTWSFHHPNHHLPNITTTTQPNPTTTLTTTPSNAHNTRHSIHTFPIPNRATCHGLAGYFEAVLYNGSPTGSVGSASTNTNKVELSTNPNTMPTKSEDMISWFPIFFPLKVPVSCPDDSSMTVQMWRQSDDRKVWYEWIVDVYVFANTGAAGAGGSRRKIRVGGSMLHSSEKEGCLM